MRIAVNAQLYPTAASYRSAGVARYIKELVARLPTVGPQHEYVFLTPPNVNVVHGLSSRLPTSNPAVRVAWEQLAEPAIARRLGAQVVHSPVNVSPLLLREPSVVTLHDLSFLRHPDRFLPAKRWYQSTMSKLSTKTAARIIVPSRITKEDAVAVYGLDESRIVVIPQGVGEEFKPNPALGRPLDEPYILYVGTLEPRKNIPLLIESFAQFRRHGYPHLLALVGPMGWMSEQVTDALARSKMTEYVRLPGYVADLAPWYNHADFLVYPSSYEGFGLPPLEAMACGTPVVLPAGGSLREVAGDAAFLIEPFTGEGLVSAMESLAGNAGLRDQLRRKGLNHASRFSWDETARRTVEVYEAVARG